MRQEIFYVPPPDPGHDYGLGLPRAQEPSSSFQILDALSHASELPWPQQMFRKASSGVIGPRQVVIPKGDTRAQKRGGERKGHSQLNEISDMSGKPGSGM